MPRPVRIPPMKQETHHERKDRLREEAQIRQEVRDMRSPQEQLQRLDDMFGVGQGARKERARLAKLC